MPGFFTIEQLAEFAHCSVRYIHEEKKRGALSCHKVGKRLIFSQEEVTKWINRKTVA